MRTTTKLVSLATMVSASVVVGMILAGSLDLTRLASAQKAAPAPAVAPNPAPRPAAGAVLALPPIPGVWKSAHVRGEPAPAPQALSAQ